MDPEPLRDQLVYFRQGELDLAIPLSWCLEVHRNMAISKLSEDPSGVGVINLRGQLVPVIDLARELDIRPDRPPLRRRILICGREGERLGLLVDDVTGLSTEPVDVQRPGSAHSRQLTSSCMGVTQFAGRLCFVLDIQSLVGSSIEERRTGPPVDGGRTDG